MPDLPASTRQPVHGEVVFHRPLAPGGQQEATLHLLDLVSLVMDRLFTVPGTRVRFGLNTLLLVVPVLGDFLTTLVSVGILVMGLSNQRVPRIVAARMVLNSVLDASLGWVPVLGDLFNLYFKADTRNVRLLQQYAGRQEQPPPSTGRHWLFVLSILALFTLILVLIVVGAVVLVRALVGALYTPGT